VPGTHKYISLYFELACEDIPPQAYVRAAHLMDDCKDAMSIGFRLTGHVTAHAISNAMPATLTSSRNDNNAAPTAPHNVGG
jgi:hypothetical protein